MALRQVLGPTRRALLPVGKRCFQDLPRTVATSAFSFHPEGPQTAPSEKETSKQGWGQTRIYEVLEDKRENSGAWLWCSKDDFMIDAIRKMAKGNVGSLLVFDPAKIDFGSDEKVKSAAGDAVVGIVTERDYLTKVVVKGKSSTSVHVKDVMTPASRLMTVTPNHSVLEVMSMMNDNNFRHVPVVNNGQYLGMVSIRDVVSVMVQEHREEVGRLHEYIQGSY
ncbi:hypothetical protein ABBQ32_003523 [Trebouxia sp. C0010 RCD-2024]